MRFPKKIRPAVIPLPMSMLTAQAPIFFSVTGPATVGGVCHFTVTCVDGFNNVQTSYPGVVTFSSTDPAWYPVAKSGLTSGTGSFSTTFNTTGNQVITCVDKLSHISGSSANINNTTPGATHLAFTAPANAASGVAFPFSVTAQGQNNTTFTGYTGTVHFSNKLHVSSDVLPGDATLTSGVGVFTATLQTVQSPLIRVLTATDTVNPLVKGSGVYAVVPASGTYPTTDPIVTPFDSVTNFALTPTVFSVQSGNWSSTSTWNTGVVPTTGDIVGIRSTHTVTYDVNSTAQITAVGIAGTLTWNPNVNTKLIVQTLMVYSIGYLEIGTVGTPIASNVTAQIIWPDAALADPNSPTDPALQNRQYSNGLLVWGKVRICGMVKTAFVRSAVEIAASASTLTLATSPTGWANGDRLLIPDSRVFNYDGAIGPPFFDEVVTISTVSGTAVTNSATAHAHLGCRDYVNAITFLPHVVNLTRNVIFKSANPNGVRGHSIYFDRADVDIEYARFDSMGRTLNNVLPDKITNQIGRYSFHAHHLWGPYPVQNQYQFVVKGCVMEDTGDPTYNAGPPLNVLVNDFKWGLTIHDSSYGLVQNNVVYKYVGASMMFEEGSEVYNLIDGNFICRSTGNSDRGDGYLNTNPTAPGREGNGMTIFNMRNYITNNVITNISTYQFDSGNGGGGVGYHIYSSTPSNGPGNASATKIPAYQGADPRTDFITGIWSYPILQFEGNEAYCMGIALVKWWIGFPGSYHNISGNDIDPTIAQSVVKSAKFWNTRYAVYGFPTYNFLYDSCIFRQSFSETAQGRTSVAFYSSDYETCRIQFNNCDIQGYLDGLFTPAKLGDVRDTNQNSTHWTWTVSNCTLCCGNDIIHKTPWADTGGNVNLPPRTTNITGCTFLPLPVSVGFLAKYLWFDWVDPTQANPGTNWVVRDQILISNINGDGKNYQYYWDQQDPNYITPATDMYGDIGSPFVGLTNATNAANYTYGNPPYPLCVGGYLRPAGTVIVSGFDGQGRIY